jgi:hypothetical protein
VVLSRREVSAILLAIAAIVLYLVLLSTTPSGAQTGNQPTTQPTTSNPANPSNQGGVIAIANSSQRPRKERSIINIPKKPLPPSGGLPVYGVVTGFVFAGAGLLALGLVIWRRPRR